MPQSLSGDGSILMASLCWDILIAYGIADNDVEIHKSIVTCSAGPALLRPVDLDVCNPISTVLVLPICAQATPWDQGSSGLFISKGG
jgi:hypothetical protein